MVIGDFIFGANGICTNITVTGTGTFTTNIYTSYGGLLTNRGILQASGVIRGAGAYQALELSINMVPEPSTVLLLVGGGLVLFRLRRGVRLR